jgi:hypothetical protein
MAIYNEIQTGQLSDILTRRLGMKEGSPAPSLQPEIHPAIVLENDRPEWQFLAGGRIMQGGLVVAALAGNRSKVRFQMPPGTNQIAVVERVLVTYSGANWAIGRNAPLGASTSFGRSTPTDFRAAAPNAAGMNGALQVAGDQSVGATPGRRLLLEGTAAVTNFVVEGPWIISPATELEVSGSNDNTAITVYAHWRERGVVPGELA